MSGDIIPQSLEGFDAGRLRFDTQDDALNFARQIVEDGRRRSSERGFSLADDYLKGRNHIHCPLYWAALRHSHDFHFIAKFAPVAAAGHLKSRPRLETWLRGEDRFCGVERDPQNALVFVRSRQAAEGVQLSIPVPSIVGLEGFYEGHEVGVDVLQAVFDLVFKLDGAPGKREVESCQRRSKDASAGRSKSTSMVLARRPPNWGPFRYASGWVG